LGKEACAALGKEACAALGKEACAALGKEASAALGKEACAALKKEELIIREQLHAVIRRILLLPEDVCRAMTQFKNKGKPGYEMTRVDVELVFRFASNLQYCAKLPDEVWNRFLHVLFFYGMGQESSFYWGCVEGLRYKRIKRMLMMPILTSDRLKPYISWHWIECSQSSLRRSFLYCSLDDAPPEFSALIYQQSHVECKNLSIKMDEKLDKDYAKPLLLWLSNRSATQVKQFIKNIEIDGSGTDLITLYPIMMKMPNVYGPQLFAQHYQKMVNYRSHIFPEIVIDALSSVLIADLSHIIASYALPRLFWDDHPDWLQHFFPSF
jgi:hypothetical protein